MKPRDGRPRILVTGEYVARTAGTLNGDLHRKIELLGGEALYVPLYLDYVEWLAAAKPAYLRKSGKLLKAAGESLIQWLCRKDIARIKSLFRPYIPDLIDPEIKESLRRTSARLSPAVDPCLSLEFHQAHWVMEAAGADGIVSVAPFGCSVATAISPLVHRTFRAAVPVLSLWLDGKSDVHADNRLAAFMENVKACSAGGNR
jgi:predicted nucleotide-binding protein (sugar kinase/HSP70/actin superfamily)